MFVLFDMDGVLLDSESLYMEAYLAAGSKYGLDENKVRDAVIRATGVTQAQERGILEETFGSVPGLSVDALREECAGYFRQAEREGRLHLKPGAGETLSFLRDRNIPVGLASSSPRELIEKYMGERGILEYFTVIVSGDMVSRGKPDPEIFLTCAAGLGIKPEEYPQTLVIEDSCNGIRAAAAAGMVPVMVPDLILPDEEIAEKCAVILPSLTAVTEWIRKRIQD